MSDLSLLLLGQVPPTLLQAVEKGGPVGVILILAIVVAAQYKENKTLHTDIHTRDREAGAVHKANGEKIAELNTAHGEKIASVVAAFNEKIAALNVLLQQREREHAEKLAEVERVHAAKTAELYERHKAETAKIMEDRIEEMETVTRMVQALDRHLATSEPSSPRGAKR